MWSKAQRIAPGLAGGLSPWKPATSQPAHGPQSGHAAHRGNATPARAAHGGATSAIGAAAFAADAEAAEPVEGAGTDEHLLEERINDAYAKGHAAGAAAAERGFDAERAQLAVTIAEIAALRRQVLDAADHDLTRLAVGMARRVLHREVQLDPDILLAMARVALGRLGPRAVARVSLHPQDLAAVSGLAAGDASIVLDADADLPRGGCRISTETGEIDLGIDAQMNELSRVLLDGVTDGHKHAQPH